MSECAGRYTEKGAKRQFLAKVRTLFDETHHLKENRISIDGSSNEGKEKESFRKGRSAWLLAKLAIFIVCVTFFFWQSAEFYQHYYTYPTTTTVAVTKPQEFKMPAITFCDRNPTKRSFFCAKYSHLCEEPQNLEQFCQKHSHFCIGNVSSLQIPKLSYYTNDSSIYIERKINRLLKKNRLGDSAFIASSHSGVMTNTMVADYDRSFSRSYGNCHSANLHLHDRKEAQTWSTDWSSEGVFEFSFFKFYLDVLKEETFFPWDEPRLYFSVHSPVAAINPLRHGKTLKIGHRYTIDVRLEEEHLLPHPYPTNCVDYEALWKINNKTGPRSQEMCKEKCLWQYEKQYENCPLFRSKMRDKEATCKNKAEFKPCKNCQFVKRLSTCLENCKPNCVKVKYVYTVSERKNEPKRFGFGDTIFVKVTASNPEVLVVSHDPLYRNGELFSYIGGLMGCWLGISVWAFAGMTEKGFQKTVQMLQNFRKMFRKSLPVEDTN